MKQLLTVIVFVLTVLTVTGQANPYSQYVPYEYVPQYVPTDYGFYERAYREVEARRNAELAQCHDDVKLAISQFQYVKPIVDGWYDVFWISPINCDNLKVRVDNGEIVESVNGIWKTKARVESGVAMKPITGSDGQMRINYFIFYTMFTNESGE